PRVPCSPLMSLHRMCLLSLLLPPHSLFFPGFGVHRDLHSFPTRRSSDLAVLDAPPVKNNSEATRTVSSGTVTCACSTAISAQVTDRKSTRLNSSHVSISYAVFCLKKKSSWQRTGVENAQSFKAQNSGSWL